jgi:glycogen operon protein
MRVTLPDALAPGWPMPFGAHPVEGGVHFALWTEHASRVELCLFDAEGTRELRRYPLHADADGVWNGFLVGAADGLVYGYRAHGPYAPEQGHRYNPYKLLLDPWAREIVGRFRWDDVQHGYVQGHPEGARSFDTRDNAAQALKARVTAPLPPLRHPRPRIADADVVLYELHVKGFTRQMPGIPDALRGRYAGLAHPAAIEHFRRLGVTTLCLLPVHHALSERHLVQAGLHNYWGYNTIGFFAADPRLAATANGATAELRAAVEALHAAGLEVILDVVYNHSAEGDELGPTISLRGLDNASWYRLLPDDPSRYVNWSGCGNTLNLHHPRVVQFVLDSLRHWVQEVGVDGFRFDLATVLGRTRTDFDPDGPFLVALRQDPVLSRVRLIAEPWDCGPQGYQVGRFPGRFFDWSDRFRDSVRRYWLPRRGVTRGEFARRFCASSDLFHHGLRRPQASVNFISAHDGRTLADVVAYGVKHNHANGEDNRDGRDDEPADNFGIEGDTTDPLVLDQRRRVRRALLATLLLAQGTPMLLAGDERANSQRGNNNAYCQDNPLGWLDWATGEDDSALVSALLTLRRAEALLRHGQWFAAAGDPERASVRWLHPAGHEMSVQDWHEHDDRALACELREAGAARARLCLVFNPAPNEREFHIDEDWALAFDSSGERLPLDESGIRPDPYLTSTLLAPAHALLVLIRMPDEESPP